MTTHISLKQKDGVQFCSCWVFPCTPPSAQGYKKIQRAISTGNDRVKIPNSMIEKLKPHGSHFIKVAKPILGDSKSGKNAVEHGFTNTPYEADDASLQLHLEHGGNYGVLAGQGIAIIDLDDKELTTIFEKKISTFTVQSGRISGEGRHYYIRTNASENGSLFTETGGNLKNVGNIQVHSKYVVGPGCHHFSGGVYSIVNDAPLAWVPKENFGEIFGDKLKWSGQMRQEQIEEAKEEKDTIDAEIPLDRIIDLREFTEHGDEYQGTHPIHGSEGGSNLCVNPSQGVWHCFRCNSGGGPLMWLAVKYGILQCHEAQKGALRGERFKEVVRLAREEGLTVALKDEALYPDVTRFFDRNKFVPAYAARELMEETGFFSESSRSILYRYDSNKGIYRADGISFIDRRLTEVLGKAYSINRRNEVQAYIQAASIGELPQANKYLIAVQNGVLDIRTRELKPFNREYYIFNALPVTYDANAQCPKYLQFLREVVPPEADRLLLQEHGGYNLLKDCRFQKALMLIGNTQNGKGTMLNVWTALLGKDNITALPLQILSDSKMRFYTSQLLGKMANICTDLPSEALKETDSFKKIVSGDPITGEVKFCPPFDFKPYAKLLYSANQLPALPKDTDAFLVRWNLVAFPNQFMPGDPRRDENLLDKLTTPEELSGILNWCLDGLDRLQAQKHFSKGETLEQARDRWLVEGDSVKAFKDRCIDEDIESSETLEDTWQAYMAFCNRHKVSRPKNKNAFGSAFSEYATKGHTRMNGKDERVWQYISLKPEDQTD